MSFSSRFWNVSTREKFQILQATVTITNFQMYRHITSPGWSLGWVWAKREVIWSMQGAEAVDQGDCSTFTETMPHSCKRDPLVVDLLPGAPYNQQVARCCKGGVLTSWGQDPSSAVSAFQFTVGHSGNSNKTVRLPKNFTFYGPGRGYTCSHPKIAPNSAFYSSDGRRKTYASSKYPNWYEEISMYREDLWDLIFVGEENETLFIRVWKPLPNKRVLKQWGWRQYIASQSGQYLLTVGLSCCYRIVDRAELPFFRFCSDMECDMHLHAVSCFWNTNLLSLHVIIL